MLMTRLSPPPQQARLLRRENVLKQIAGAIDYPLTLLIAPAGSGKTTALATLAATGEWPAAWCRMSAADDPALLLRHLTAAFRPVVTIDEERINTELERVEPGLHQVGDISTTLQAALDVLVNELAALLSNETLLILDDYHQADQNPALRLLVERLVTIQPMRLHIIIAARYEPQLESLATARARGEVYELGQSDLAFTVDDARELFALYDQPPPADITELTEVCRGWPLALHLGIGGWGVGLAPTPSAHLLDEYLKREVLEVQPADLQNFLLRTAGLRWLDPDAYAVLPGSGDHANAPFLACEAERRCLFLEALPDEVPNQPSRLAYQPLFRAFLDRQAMQRLTNWRDLHRCAADYYRTHGDDEGAIHHLLAAGDMANAARALEQAARTWLDAQNAPLLLDWLDRFPRQYQQWPTLLESRAAAQRQLGNFDKALQIYKQAETAFQQQKDRDGHIRVLRGRAEVYLDTVQPAPAVELLKKALKLMPRDRFRERAELLRLQAENWANCGRADIALRLESCAHELAQGEQLKGWREPVEHIVAAEQTAESPESFAPPRLLLRSGRLHEARRQLEADLGLDEQEAMSGRIPSLVSTMAHREPLLLLSLIYSLLGNGAKALAMARLGLLEAQRGPSRLTEAIAHMRVGHAYQLVAPRETAAARQRYHEALALVQAAGVSRTKAEICLGLTLLHGRDGDLTAAESSAHEGLQIAETAGDEWTAALIWLALGGAAVTVADKRAPEWLDQARQRLIRGGDTYGQAVAALWMALWCIHNGNNDEANQQVTQLLDFIIQYGYEGLLTAPTLFGPADMAMLVPILLKGRSQPPYTPLAQKLLRLAFPTIATDEAVDDYHPGYTLRIQMFGTFRVWRGWHEIQAREWQREKARQLFQLLLTYRGHWLQREQICAWLWPDSDLDAAERQFKVTLNALNAALEPMRPPRTAPFFIRRQGLAYSFAPSYGCWIDVDEFELRVAGAANQDDPDFALRNSQMAVQLYRGDYLAESLYDSWTLEERERLLARFLVTATMHANRLVNAGDLQQAVQLCEQVLRRDRCYEEAYQVLMIAHARSGSRSQAMRSYNRCVQALRDDLGIELLPETIKLYEQIKRNEKI
jgi:ATP/maltotriose-dependent transcriptional regulator MalT/two-component SAPR family response regulator